jgi:hypothetical protein
VTEMPGSVDSVDDSGDTSPSMRIRTVARAVAVVWCASAGAVYLGCSADTEVALTTVLAGAEDASTVRDAGAGDTSVSVPDSGCPDSGNEAPDDLRCTGLYSDWGSKTVDPKNEPYAPGIIFWSDGARKARYLYLPPGSKIDTSDMDQWSFPVGTRVWKEFSFDGRRVETRFFEKTAAAPTAARAGEWTWGTYQWSGDQSTATLVTDGVGDAGPNNYSIPASRDCPTCHAGGKRDALLGIEAFALGLPTASGETLAQLQSEGRFTVNPPATTIHAPDDTKGSAAALGYLHMNCGVSCHNDNPFAFCAVSGLFMRLSATDAFSDAGADAVKATTTYTTAIGIAPTVFTVRYPPANNWFRIASGDVSMSEIPGVFASRGLPEQMPPLATHVVDDAGVDILTTWIQAGP